MNANAIAPIRLHRDLAAFFLLTFLLSWAIEVPLALQTQGVIRPVFPMGLHYSGILRTTCWRLSS